MEVDTSMDLFEHRYYRLNKFFMKLIGQWPYQSPRVRYIRFIMLLFFATTHMIPQIMAIAKNYNDWDFVIQCMFPLLFVAFCTTKYFSYIFNSQKMLMMFNHIRTDWKVWARDRDVEVLHEYAQKGRMLTILAIVLSYITCNIFIIQPVIPKIVDVILRNGTETGQFPIPVDYYHIDMQKYYFYIILHSYLNTSMAFIVTMSYDSMVFITVQHGCGLFAALGHQLQRIGKNKRSAETSGIVDALEHQDVEMTHLRWCNNRHCDAIEFAELLEETNSWCFLIVMGLNMLLISITGLEVVKKGVDRQQSIRFAFTNILCLMHIYLDNHMAQILMDHSISIRYHLYECDWNKLPTKTQKILLFMMMRCNVPCILTAGKMATMSIETFVVFLKTSLSYFTLLRSV